jgi:FkbH-like protein
MNLQPWLPYHPDLSLALRQVRQIEDRTSQLRELIVLCGFARDVVATGRLDRLVQQCLVDADPAQFGLSSIRLAALGSHSLEHLVPAMRVGALERGVALSVQVGAYGQFRQALMLGDAELAAFAPQLLLLAIDGPSIIPAMPLSAGRDEVRSAVDRVVEEVRGLWRNARERFGAQPVHQSLLPAVPPLIGSNEMTLPASPNALSARLNLALIDAAAEDGVLVLDIADRIPRRFGDERLLDPVRWHQAKQLINPVFAPLYGDLAGSVVAAVAGRSRKCLVLDLDNTLWGGVVGDDGIDGIRLGQGSAEGEAYLAFQRYVAGLGQRGVILAVCSKNDGTIAQSVFEQHPEMQLRPSDIACFVANWSDKASNLRTIARTLNIGLDALVFVDDNPVERSIIRRELPEVAVPEMPDDVAFYPEVLASAGYFETAAITADDFIRSQSYRGNARRVAATESATDMDGFLQSLEMTLLANRIGAIDRPRAAQLINKSNQFNLTTVRRTVEELEALVEDPEVIALSLRLRDSFGDNGLISVLLARKDPAWSPDELLIDTWLMSCRVLGRGVEAAALGVLVNEAARTGATAVIGEFRPTGRNALVQDHYPRLGFSQIDAPKSAPAGATFWRLPLGGTPTPAHHIKVEIVA